MALLSILCVFLLARYTEAARWLQGDAIYASLLDGLAKRWPNRWWAFAALPVAGAVLLAGLWWSLGFWSAFLLSVPLLLHSVGRGDWGKGMHDLAQELKEGNAEAVWLQLESRGWLSNASDASEQRLWLAWLRCAGCWYLDRLFAVFFWFFFLGPVGAVFYRWVVLYNQHPQVINKHLPSAAQWQHALEWLPVRYMGLCACLAGNFTTGIRAWQQSVLNLSITSADFLAHCLGAALLADSTVSTSSQEADSELQQTLARSPALEELMVRTEIIGLVGISVAILVLR